MPTRFATVCGGVSLRPHAGYSEERHRNQVYHSLFNMPLKQGWSNHTDRMQPGEIKSMDLGRGE